MNSASRPWIKIRCIRTVLTSAVCAIVLMGSADRSRADQTYVDLTTENGITASIDGEDVYVDPYFGKVGTNPNGSLNTAATLFCDDFAHHSSNGTTFLANVSYFDTLSDVRFTPAPSGGYGGDSSVTSTLQAYDAAAWLASQMESLGSSVWATDTLALWAIFDPNIIGTIGWTSDAATALQTALVTNTYTANEFSNWAVLTPVCGTNPTCAASSQEFLVDTSKTPFSVITPEPSSLVMIGFGLLMLVGLVRRRVSGTETKKDSFIAAS